MKLLRVGAKGAEKPAMVARWLSLFATREDGANVAGPVGS